MMCFFHKIWWEIGRGKCNNQPLSTSIRLVIETMGVGGGNVTISRVEGRQERKKVEATTITSNHAVRGVRVNATINLF
jgi:hypothetical protein